MEWGASRPVAHGRWVVSVALLGGLGAVPFSWVRDGWTGYLEGVVACYGLPYGTGACFRGAVMGGLGILKGYGVWLAPLD